MDWITGSRAELKKDISYYDGNALDEIKNTWVYRYRLKNENSKWKTNNRERLGFIIGEGYSISQELLDGSGGNVDIYAAIGLAYKAIQELNEKIEQLKEKIL